MSFLHAAVAIGIFASQPVAPQPFYPVAGTEILLEVDWNLVTDPSPAPLTIAFPDGAQQGSDMWWIGDLSFEVESSPAGSDGEFRVDCGTGGYSAFLIIFERAPGRDLEARLHDLIDGDRRVVLDGGTEKLRYRNYLRNQGVTPGASSFSCFSEGDPTIGIKSLVIGPKSLIYDLRHDTLADASRNSLPVGEAGRCRDVLGLV